MMKKSDKEIILEIVLSTQRRKLQAQPSARRRGLPSARQRSSLRSMTTQNEATQPAPMLFEGMDEIICASGNYILDYDEVQGFLCKEFQGSLSRTHVLFFNLEAGVAHFLDHHLRGLSFSAGNNYFQVQNNQYLWRRRIGGSPSDDDIIIGTFTSAAECVWKIYYNRE